MQAAHPNALTHQSQLALISDGNPTDREIVWNGWPAETPLPIWRSLVLMGAAATATTAALSLATSIPQESVPSPLVNEPPTDRGQSQAVGGETCSEICQDLKYTQTQMQQVRRHIAERRVALQAHQAQHRVPQPQETAQAIAQQARTAQVQREKVEQEANQIRQELFEINQQLGLSSDAATIDVLARTPEYTQRLQQWQQIDRQLAEVSNATFLKGPIWDPREHDFPAPTASKSSLLAQHQKISGQLQGSIEDVYLTPVQSYFPEVTKAIAEDPVRLAYVKPWLVKNHRLKILEGRQETLNYLADRLEQQQQVWQRIAQRQEFLETDIARAEETLAVYTAQAQRLQNYLHAEQQVISSPDLISAQ